MVRGNYRRSRDISLKTKSIQASGMSDPKTLGLTTMPDSRNFGSGSYATLSDFGLSR
jgi:hypothetical protein